MNLLTMTNTFIQIAESGLPLHAFDSFEDAAKKVISLARQS